MNQTIFCRNLRGITFRLTNVIPERIIFVSGGITNVLLATFPAHFHAFRCVTLIYSDSAWCWVQVTNILITYFVPCSRCSSLAEVWLLPSAPLSASFLETWIPITWCSHNTYHTFYTKFMYYEVNLLWSTWKGPSASHCLYPVSWIQFHCFKRCLYRSYYSIFHTR